jgi:tetratricopeptide (TPR) repeat protein
MNRSRSRFKNHLDDNLVHIHKNLYISPADPLYYEKVIRYLDPYSPEAHFKLGQKHQTKGNLPKAKFHYQETLRTYPSPYYSAANKALRQLSLKTGEKSAHAESAAAEEHVNEAKSPFISMLLIVLLLLNILIVVLYFSADSISTTISKVKHWPVGKEITYETTDIPYLMHFPYETPRVRIESAIHKQAIDLGHTHTKQNILIYGLQSSTQIIDKNAIPLLDKHVPDQAFVIAEYNASMDQTVKIRFLDPEIDQKLPLSAIGANLVRTALDTYIQDFGKPPESLDQLIQDYPHNYLSFIPLESISHSNKVASAYSGEGGWVYNAFSDNMALMFYPNNLERTSLPYEPIHIEIVKSEHSLKLISGSQLIMVKKAGLGANQQTPEAHFAVQNRVLNPQGSKQGVYGTAGLGLGMLAIHGTNDESSVGTDRSLGCIRLINSDINQLFAFVPKGTVVEIADQGTPSSNNDREELPITSEIIPAIIPPIRETSMKQTFLWLG